MSPETTSRTGSARPAVSAVSVYAPLGEKNLSVPSAPAVSVEGLCPRALRDLCGQNTLYQPRQRAIPASPRLFAETANI